MRTVILLLITITAIMSCGCGKIQTSKQKPVCKSNVMLVEKEMRKYIHKARKNKKNIDKLYEEIVCKALYDLDDVFIDNPYIKTSINDLDALEEELDILDKEDALGIVKNALNKCENSLKSQDTNIWIFPCNPEDNFVKYRMSGVSGVTFCKGKILLFINPTAENWKTMLPYAVAHEYHHSTCIETKFKEDRITLLNYMLLEGMADSFANILYPDRNVPWVSSISGDDERKVWNKIRDNLDSTDENYRNNIIFGYGTEFPVWSGYTIGYNIVQAFLKNNPNMSIEEWTYMDGKDMLKNSGYEKKMDNKY